MGFSSVNLTDSYLSKVLLRPKYKNKNSLVGEFLKTTTWKWKIKESHYKSSIFRLTWERLFHFHKTTNKSVSNRGL